MEKSQERGNVLRALQLRHVVLDFPNSSSRKSRRPSEGFSKRRG